MPAVFFGYVIGRSTSHGESGARAAVAKAAVSPWSLENGDLLNTRETRSSSITLAKVAKLGVAWTMPLTASGIYGTFAANPVTAFPAARDRRPR